MLFFVGCGDLNVEVQQTSRTNTSAARDPVSENSDTQGSERTQGKSPKVKFDTTVSEEFNPSGAER